MKSENNIVEGALKVHKLTFWEAAMIIVGANIGSGILGLAYSARKAGWPVLMLWLIIAGFFTTASMLYVAETTLRTRKVMQLPGLAKKYVGELGAWLVFISVAANTIGCLIAYTNGSGRILSEMFGLSTQIGSLLFSVPAVIVVWFGLKATGVAEKVISFGMMALLAAAVIRNLSDLTGRYEVFSKEIDVMGSVSLSIFLSMALMGLKLWQLSELALPLVVMLLAQTAMMALFARFVIFNLMGRDYEAAVITAAGCGFGMGATPNAMANMNAIVARYGPAPKAYFIVPLVGSLFIDFINAFIITLFLNMF